MGKKRYEKDMKSFFKMIDAIYGMLLMSLNTLISRMENLGDYFILSFDDNNCLYFRGTNNESEKMAKTFNGHFLQIRRIANAGYFPNDSHTIKDLAKFIRQFNNTEIFEKLLRYFGLSDSDKWLLQLDFLCTLFVRPEFFDIPEIENLGFFRKACIDGDTITAKIIIADPRSEYIRCANNEITYNPFSWRVCCNYFTISCRYGCSEIIKCALKQFGEFSKGAWTEIYLEELLYAHENNNVATKKVLIDWTKNFDILKYLSKNDKLKDIPKSILECIFEERYFLQ